MKYQVFEEKLNLVFLEGFETADSLFRWITKNLPTWKLDGLKVVAPSGHVYLVRKEPH